MMKIAIIILSLVLFASLVSAQTCPCACQPTVTIPGVSNFPPGILDQLKALTGYNALQITNILGMIQGPEQGRTEWWLTADAQPIWGYAEDIGDGRGVTVGLYGATTGQGYNDADILWNLYGRNLGTGSTSQIIANIRAVQNDPAWKLAMFKAYIQTYWTPCKNMLVAAGVPYSALTFGAVLDATMNAGIGDDSSTSWGSQHLITEAKKTTSTDSAFLTRFLQLRAQYPTERSGEMTKRIAAWQKLLTAQQFNMNSATLLKKGYVYIPAGWATNITIIDDGTGLRSASLDFGEQLDAVEDLAPVKPMSLRGTGDSSPSAKGVSWATWMMLASVTVLAIVSPVVMMWG